ncbi:MAG: helix-turn-helix transcriptional regulator [Clostridia bacterium]|nr:helix-turn-helix transcriptional regulator [Clostridia bacterium]
MTFYEALSKLMKERNVTSKELSETLKFGKNQIKYWKDNGNIPNGEILIDLSDYFNVPVDFLLGTGVFKNWEDINNKRRKDMLLTLFKSAFPDININFSEIFNDEIKLIRFLDLTVKRIEINEGDGLDVYLYGNVNDTAPAKINVSDTNKQKLMNNYDLLNNEGQQDLVDYSYMLAVNPRKLKESDKTVSIDASKSAVQKDG